MGYGTELITDPNNRLIGGAGAWVSHDGGGDGGFMGGGGGATLFQNSYLKVAWGTLDKAFFSPLVAPGVYVIAFEIMWPSTLYYHSANFLITAGPSSSYGCAWTHVPANTWRSISSAFTTEPPFDNDLREMRFQLTNIEHEPVEVSIKNLSVRRYTPPKIGYLTLVGVG